MDQTQITAGPLALTALDHALVLNMFERFEAHQSVFVSWPANDLDGTVLPEVSLDGGSNWKASQFASPESGLVTLFASGDGTNTADSFIILIPGGATHARVRISSYTSGSITPTMRAASLPTSFVYGPDGVNLRAPAVKNVTPDTCDYGLSVRIIGSSAGGSAITDDAAFTPGTTSVTVAAGVYQSTPDQVNDGDAGALRMSISRGLVLGGMETPTGDSMLDDTNNALQTSPVTVVTIGGQSATSTTTPYTVCDEQFSRRFNGAQTGELVCGLSGKRVRICALVVLATADTCVAFVRGTGTCCANVQANITSLNLSTTSGLGFTLGNGGAVIMDGVANTCSICAINGSATGLTIFGRYAIY